MNSGNDKLAEVAGAWAKEKGIETKAVGASGAVKWGSMKSL
jgi:hypothetical protein